MPALVLVREYPRRPGEGAHRARARGAPRDERVDGPGRAVVLAGEGAQPRGQLLFEGTWEPPELPEDALEALIEEHRGRGIEPDGQTAGARWKSEEEIPSEVYFAASEALL